MLSNTDVAYLTASEKAERAAAAAILAVHDAYFMTAERYADRMWLIAENFP